MESWNGQNWTEVGDLNTARGSLGGFGTSTAGFGTATSAGLIAGMAQLKSL